MSDRPQLWVFAGPNGAGKSTLAARFLKDRLPIVNPDVIAAQDIPRKPDGKLDEQQAGKIAVRQRLAHLSSRESFAFETTLTGRSEIRVMQAARDAGYKVNLVYVGVSSAERSADRVAGRVQEGGHDVPPDAISRRYPKSMEQLAEAARLSERVIVFDNSHASHRLLLVHENGQNRLHSPLPAWARQALPQEFQHPATAPQHEQNPRASIGKAGTMSESLNLSDRLEKIGQTPEAGARGLNDNDRAAGERFRDAEKLLAQISATAHEIDKLYWTRDRASTWEADVARWQKAFDDRLTEGLQNPIAAKILTQYGYGSVESANREMREGAIVGRDIERGLAEARKESIQANAEPLADRLMWARQAADRLNAVHEQRDNGVSVGNTEQHATAHLVATVRDLRDEATARNVSPRAFEQAAQDGDVRTVHRMLNQIENPLQARIELAQTQIDAVEKSVRGVRLSMERDEAANLSPADRAARWPGMTQHARDGLREARDSLAWIKDRALGAEISAIHREVSEKLRSLTQKDNAVKDEIKAIDRRIEERTQNASPVRRLVEKLTGQNPDVERDRAERARLAEQVKANAAEWNRLEQYSKSWTDQVPKAQTSPVEKLAVERLQGRDASALPFKAIEQLSERVFNATSDVRTLETKAQVAVQSQERLERAQSIGRQRSQDRGQEHDR